MTLYLRARRVGATTLVIGGTLAFGVLAGGLALPVFSLTGGAASVPVALIVPLGFALAVGWTLSNGLPEHEMTAARCVRGADLALIVVLLAGVALATALVGWSGWFGWSDHAPAVVRNTAGLVGVVLVARRWLPPTGAGALAGAYVLASMLVGVGADGKPLPWAWVLAPDGTRAALFATGCLLIGLGLQAVGSRPWPSRWRHTT